MCIHKVARRSITGDRFENAVRLRGDRQVSRRLRSIRLLYHYVNVIAIAIRLSLLCYYISDTL